jgi:carbonic anhydrase
MPPGSPRVHRIVEMTGYFADLLAAKHDYADRFGLGGSDGIAHAGVAIVTCMDSRIDPLSMVGLRPGDAKILRNLAVGSPSRPCRPSS